MFPDEVYIFTPNGNILSLPNGATPVDFAYAIHTDVGNSCIGCKIDKKLAPLSQKLTNGQTVEIITAPGARPNPAWMSFVITGKARANIRHFLKKLRRDEAISLGRRLLEKELTEHNLDEIDPKSVQRAVVATKHQNLDDLLVDIGLGITAALVVAHHMEDKHDKAHGEAGSAGKPLAIKGTEGVLVSYAKCCHPIPGDPVVGFVSSGKGIMIHLESCRNLDDLRSHTNKIISVHWEDEIEGEFQAKIRVEVFNSRGVLASLTRVMADEHANIVNMDIDEKDGSTNSIDFVIGVKDRIHLAQVIKRIRKFKFVNKIARI